MSLLDRIRACHPGDLRRFRPFMIGGDPVGLVGPAMADRLRGFPEVFVVAPARIGLRDGLESFHARSEAVAGVLARLREEGLITGWRDEAMAVSASFHAPPLMQIERAAVKAFGIRYYCIQINGTVGAGADMRMWIARRARSKAVGPGKLDQIVGGGVPIGVSLADNIVRECAEEATMPENLARQARPVGACAILAEDGDGLWNEVSFNYDLDLPADFTPRSADGEVEWFQLWPLARVRQALAETDEFLFDVAPLIIDFFVRHGLLTPEDPDYLDIVGGLSIWSD